jgi:parallel beta-helix repeat protein
MRRSAGSPARVPWFAAAAVVVGSMLAGALVAACSPPVPPGPTRVPGSTPPARGAAPPASVEPCARTLRDLVAAASPGDTVRAPACVYREEVAIDKSISLVAEPGAEIRGSDVWTDWQRVGERWLGDRVPAFEDSGECRTDDSLCRRPEQVFIDGRPLTRVAGEPSTGQFAIDGDRRVVLADDPTGRLVEVATREHWITVTAPDVTVRGFVMTHAASPAQNGALQARAGADRLSIVDNRLSEGHAALISLQDLRGARIEGNDLGWGGQLAIHMGGERGVSDIEVSGNRIHDNNTQGFNPGWEAGGMKVSISDHVTIADNEIWGNGGPGVWVDIRSSDVVVSGNRIHHNERSGIFFEISSRGRIVSNEIWENGYGAPDWMQGSGILLHTSNHTEVADNTLAWNADGIGFQSQDRDDRPEDPTDNSIHDNVIVMEDGGDTKLALGWVQDWNGPLFDAAANNRGDRNAFYYPGPEGQFDRFGWDGPAKRLAAFNETPGGREGRYLTPDEASAVLRRLGLLPGG